MIRDLEELREKAIAELNQAETEEALLTVRTRYLGRKGLLTGLLRNISQTTPEERPYFGKRSNEIKEILTGAIDEALQRLSHKKREHALQKEKIDVTLPGRAVRP
ncbi:MAG: phenylalanine--tRNA ligase subunit alpha, partial [Syntrophus sp. (in: bacteria)]|nr:phenylalanine--tRNA ligase subunit alpha [Syntrophus sp. (in: bacteria)]